MSILPSPPVRLPQEGEGVRRVERETDRQESGRRDQPDPRDRHGGAAEDEHPDIEVDVSEEYVAEHAAHPEPPPEPDADAGAAEPCDEQDAGAASAPHIDIEA